MANREQIREQMTRDGIKYILTQFVDIHGAAKGEAGAGRRVLTT